MHTIYVLVTSPRVPAGLLSARAWELLHAHPIYATSESELQEQLTAAGKTVHVIPDPTKALLESDQDVVWLAGPEGDLARQLAGATVRASDPPTLEVIYGSWDQPGARLLDVVAVLDRLRSPGGCPWDAEQTHRTLMPYLLEEAYEAYDALDSGDEQHMREELGDVLLQVVFHSRLGAESEKPWTIDDVAAGLVDKLVSRHPHVFADVVASDADEVKQNWEQIKREEKSRKSALDGVPRSQPALALAAKYLLKNEQFDVGAPVKKADVPEDEEELGDLLFSIVAGARSQGLDAEAALRAAADRFAGQVRARESKGQ
ncbi:MAG: MazG family protein [Corynebacteriales bacterium]|nr:MazG family protein [Mycobacteriales bacterium]